MLDSRAYTEAFFIINEMSEELRSKIPNEIIKNIERKMNKNYEFYLDDDIENAELLDDTEKILSVLYTDYLATDEERKIIENKEKTSSQKSKVNLPDVTINEIFQSDAEIEGEKKELAEIKKDKWYNNMFKNLKEFFGKLIK